MPLILNGNSLLKNTSGGLATTTACCCGSDPDPDPEGGDVCFCNDFCLYRMEIVEYGVASNPATNCQNDGYVTFDRSSDLVCTCSATTPTGPSSSGWPALSSASGSVSARAGSLLALFRGDIDGTFLQTSVRVDFYLQCQYYLDANGKLVPQIKAVVSWSGSVLKGFADEPNMGRVYGGKFTEFEVSSACKKQPPRDSCSWDRTVETLQLDTPLELTINGGANPPQGAWINESREEIGNQEIVGPCFDDCVSTLPITFRITRLPSCRVVACSCTQNLNGLLANFQGKQFTLGTAASFTEANGIEWFYSVASGQHVFEYIVPVVSPAGAPQEIKMATLYCEQDDSVDPPVDRWYVLFETWCYSYADGVQTEQTKNAEVGYLPCYESEGCAGRAAGDPIPSGQAVEIEQLEGYPQTPEEFNACTPPARAEFQLVENCG